jgi:hypothetical protein
MTEPKGLIPRKYDVIKSDGTRVDGDYFVLRPGRDPHAAAALRAYANSVGADNPDLARDLYDWLDSLGVVERSEEPFPP